MCNFYEYREKTGKVTLIIYFYLSQHISQILASTCDQELKTTGFILPFFGSVLVQCMFDDSNTSTGTAMCLR